MASLFTLIFGMGPSEIIIILIIVLLLFGGKKIPELMRGVGKGIREFKDAKENVTNEFDINLNKKDKIK